MTLDPLKVIQTILNIGAKPAMQQLQRNELVIRVLKDLNLDPTQPPDDVDGVYAIALVEYGVDKPESILNLLRQNEIKKAFWEAYTSKNPFKFLKKVEDFIKPVDDWNSLGDEIRESGLDIADEIEKFGQGFIDVAKRTKSAKFEPYPDWNMDYYPGVRKSLFQEKVKRFCGRGFVFEALQEFLNKNDKGYFIVLGDAGMGKSTIAAKYIVDHNVPCYFNVRAEGINKPELFLDSIRKQLTKRYQLQNTEKDDLAVLLEKASKKLSSGERLLIVLDALDEVEQEGEQNLLYLPTTLPNGVYFLLTRRPYNSDNKRFSVSPDIPMEELDLRKYDDLSRRDVEEYIGLYLNKDPDYKDALNQWILDRNIPGQDFIKQVAIKSENNFMYLRYVLPAIARGDYNDLNLKELPDGLQDYYDQHWKLMKMDDAAKETKVIVLFILVEIGTPITCELIAEIAEQDEYDVEQILDEWVEYVTKKEIEDEICYSIYHASFLDFLKDKRELKSTRKLFELVNERISAKLYS